MITPLFFAFVALAAPRPTFGGSPNRLPAEIAVRFDDNRNTVARMEGKNLLRTVPAKARLGQTDPATAAIGFVSAYREVFRLQNPAKELKVAAVKADELGFHHVRLAQSYKGLEVAGGEMLLHFNREGELYLLTGSYIPTPVLEDLKPRLDPAAAVRAAATELSAKVADWPATLKLWPSPRGEALLAYEIAAAPAPDQAWRVFVDARSGKILERLATVFTRSITMPPPPTRPPAP